MQAFEAEAEDPPDWQVVEPGEPASDPESCLAVVPREPSRGDRGGGGRSRTRRRGCQFRRPRPEREWAMPHPIVQRFEQRLRKPIHRDVQEAARASPARAQPDERRVNRPARQPVHEEAPARGQAATSLDRQREGHRSRAKLSSRLCSSTRSSRTPSSPTSCPASRLGARGRNQGDGKRLAKPFSHCVGTFRAREAGCRCLRVFAATMVVGCSSGDDGTSADGGRFTIVTDIDFTTETGTFRVKKGSEELGCSAARS